MTGLPHVTLANYDEIMRDQCRLVMLVFQAEWSPPAKQVAAIASRIACDRGGKLNAAVVDLDTDPEIAGRFGVTALPRTLFVRQGEVVGSIEGLHMPAIYERALDAIDALDEPQRN